MKTNDADSARDVFRRIADRAGGQPWSDAVIGAWPTPIANEWSQLLKMLDAGEDAGGVLMQVRDVAEVLVKTLVLTFAADLISHGAPAAAACARGVLFSHPLSLGHWVGGLSRMAEAQRTEGALLAPEILSLAGPHTAFATAMGGYVEHRNRDIGHTAFRPDSVEIAQRVEQQILGGDGSKGLIRAFAAVEESGLWRACALRLDGPGGPDLSGADQVHRPRQDAGHTHHGSARRLFLVRGDRALDLHPFVGARVCSECKYRDLFLYDSPRSRSAHVDDRFDFLDYAQGHRLRVKGRQDDDEALAVLADLRDDELQAFIDHADGGEFNSPAVIALLDDVLFDNRFISPEWLRDRLRDHMQARRKGIFWLRAPAHVGKTMFVRGLFGEGLSEKEKLRQRMLLGDWTKIEVAPLFLKREYRFDVPQFAARLSNQVRGAIRAEHRQSLSLPIVGDAKTLQEGFITFLHETADAWRARENNRVILAIDGLDELAPTEGGPDALDYFPPAEALPDWLTLLVTSRPVAECPPWMQRKLEGGVMAGADIHDLGVEEPAYQQLLRDYISRHSGVGPGDQDFERTCDVLLRKSRSLFLTVSFLCDRVREEAAAA